MLGSEEQTFEKRLALRMAVIDKIGRYRQRDESQGHQCE